MVDSLLYLISNGCSKKNGLKWNVKNVAKDASSSFFFFDKWEAIDCVWNGGRETVFSSESCLLNVGLSAKQDKLSAARQSAAF